MTEMPLLKIGDLEARVPIIQGGMGVGVSLSGLASAVAKEGAIGVISSAAIGMLEPDFGKDFREANARVLRKEIRKAKETKGIIGVNIMVALSDYDDHVNISVEEGADPVSYTHLRAHETRHDLVCRLLLEKKKKKTKNAMLHQNSSENKKTEKIKKNKN